MFRSVLTSILDNWRDRVVPVLWAAFLAGMLIALSGKVAELTDGAVSSGLGRDAREAIRADLEDLVPVRLALFDEWAAGQRRADGSDPVETAGALLRYFRHDGGALFVLGSTDASRLMSWAGRIKRRFHPLPVFSLLLGALALSAVMCSQSDVRGWRVAGYFSSRLLVAAAFLWGALGLMETLGELWLMGSAMGSLPSLPSNVALWGMVLASGPVLSACLILMALCCLYVALGALFPDP
ncbi:MULTISPECIES: hypothetical protein [Dethiosulfovibrio]|uniref:ABC transporter permease n=2 Tax=Dethiosulfovibrio TaxID=47054 RepID=A0ABS9ENN4_9BACT|nr:MULTISPECIES: hypothetical protein [Dethiosulfovibrio]MCF4114573.1 hypothetical protein [Dethiosulfovibrio russensis]MCF4142797.1 hypothetical protein [Dethiosulfovibrio marinus]MCF4144874.1 hypothetical protein [Dethiosulfovibrio acidaminovorans]